MNKKILGLAAVLLGSLFVGFNAQADCCCNHGSDAVYIEDTREADALSYFAGVISGATLAGVYEDECYVDLAYPVQEVYYVDAYNYPATWFNPIYPDSTYTLYPSYY